MSSQRHSVSGAKRLTDREREEKRERMNKVRGERERGGGSGERGG